MMLHYYTPKLEIKPQLRERRAENGIHYYTPKLEIKPQPAVSLTS